MESCDMALDSNQEFTYDQESTNTNGLEACMIILVVCRLSAFQVVVASGSQRLVPSPVVEDDRPNSLPEPRCKGFVPRFRTR